jgi:malonyl-CoA decarboxylase
MNEAHPLSNTTSQPDLRDLCAEMVDKRGKASARAVAVDFIAGYAKLDQAGKLAFFTHLLQDYAPSPDAVDAAIEIYRSTPSPTTMSELGEAVEAPRRSVFRVCNTAPGGTGAVVQMRSDLLNLLPSHPELQPVESDMRKLLTAWFNPGFLTLEAITFSTPAHVLDKLIAYEAVHEIAGWDDLRRRLADDRRCFGFFHPALPGEPVIFVEVAFTDGLAASIQDVLDQPTPEPGAALDSRVDTAIFYSITNCQPGLRGISFGDFLIKQVTERLAEETPQLKAFSTLSPMPGFGSWLANQDEHHHLQTLLTDHTWVDDERRESMREPLLSAAAQYLLTAKRRIRPRDPVARFHLRNGARLERLNHLGDISAKGLAESAGMLVNYVYDKTELTTNHEAYMEDGTVAHSPEISELLERP